MADALLAGLPRIVRAWEEMRLRGILALAVAVSAVAWWMTQWLLDQPLEATRTLLVGLVVFGLGLVLGILNARRRVRDGLAEPRTPNTRVVYETRADARARRIKYSGAVFLTVMMVLMFDALAQWSGVTAGIVAGAAVAAAVADLHEARLWRLAERERGSELYVLVRAAALVASYGRVDLYEVPPEVAERERAEDPFSL